MHEPTKRLTADDAKARADECREMAKRVVRAEHRIILEQMAEMWEGLAKNLTTVAG
jgi:hypothetical protein